jgi:hypothetical protein
MDDVKFYDLTNPVFTSIMWRLAIDIVSLFILIRVIYFRYSGKERFFFSFFLIGILTFFVTSVLNSVFIQMAGAFGLFAVLGILRMRTRNFSVKDMAYTFATLGISVINALNVLKFPLLGILVINAVILTATWLLERFSVTHRSDTFTISYENIPMLKPDMKEGLYKEISELTGKKVFKIRIRNIDYRKSVASLEITCRDHV